MNTVLPTSKSDTAIAFPTPLISLFGVSAGAISPHPTAPLTLLQGRRIGKMGCGASSVESEAAAPKCPNVWHKRQGLIEGWADSPPSTQPSSPVDTGTTLRTPCSPAGDTASTGAPPPLSQGDPRHRFCKGPDETQLNIPPYCHTPMTAGPRRSGIHFRPSPKCKTQVLFVCRDAATVASPGVSNNADTPVGKLSRSATAPVNTFSSRLRDGTPPTSPALYSTPTAKDGTQLLSSSVSLVPPETGARANIELKSFNTLDDLKSEWSETGTGVQGAYYAVPINDVACVASVAPNKYMYRWNVGGSRCASPAKIRHIAARLHEALGQEELEKRVLKILRGEGATAADVRELLGHLPSCVSARYLSNDLAGFKSLLVALEDSMLYNMFEFKLTVEAQVGYFHCARHSVTNRERVNLLFLKEYTAKKTVQTALERERKAMRSGVKDHLRMQTESAGLDLDLCMPHVDDDLEEITATIDAANVDGTCEHLGLTLSSSRYNERECVDRDLLARENDPFDVQQRVQNFYRESYATSSPLVPMLCPQSLYHVDLYIVFPRFFGASNPFSRAYLLIWEEGSMPCASRVAMKPYWIGTPGSGYDTGSSNSDSEAGETDDQEEGDDDDPDGCYGLGYGDDSNDGDEEEEDEDYDDATPHWRGYYCTVPLQPDVVYCYRIVIDRLAYLSPTTTRKNRALYYKKVKISPSVASWTVNTAAHESSLCATSTMATKPMHENLPFNTMR